MCFLLYRQPTDMRKSFDGLCGLVTNRLQKNPTSGEVFMFVNKSKNKIKLLHWERGGFVLYYKRLETGTLELPEITENTHSVQLNHTELILMIEGISLKNIVQKKRFLTKT